MAHWLVILLMGIAGFMATVQSAIADVPSCRFAIGQLVSSPQGWVTTPGSSRSATNVNLTIPAGNTVLVPAVQHNSTIICMASQEDKSEGLGYVWSSGINTRDTDVDSITTSGAVTSTKGYQYTYSNMKTRGAPWSRSNWSAPVVVLMCRENATGHIASISYPGDSLLVPPQGGGMAFIRCPGSGTREVTMSFSSSPFFGVINSSVSALSDNNIKQQCNLNSPNSGGYTSVSGGPVSCGGIVGIADGSAGPSGFLSDISTQNARTLISSLRNIGTGTLDSWQATNCTVSLSQGTLDWGVVDEETLTTANGISPLTVTVTASCSGWGSSAPSQKRNWIYIDGPVGYEVTKGNSSYSGQFYLSDNPSMGFALTKYGSTKVTPGSLALPVRLNLPAVTPSGGNSVQNMDLEFTPFLFQGDTLYGEGEVNLTIDVWTNVVEST
ncbi:hypothetical protein [Enterobacter ludwigii]|uniref:hypothetical protein n=1 Tax=Enterobacter ludwigii TaxID=299767 RepID=UPI0013D03803|nr:hypothetical protein [Enterobacter ludwigii]